MTPGRLLHQLARWFCSDGFRSRVVEAQLADWQHEWAMTSGAVEKGIVLARGYGAFWRALGSGALHGLRSEIFGLTWRTFALPGVIGTTIVLFKLAETWVRTGAVWDLRLNEINTLAMWTMVPIMLVGRLYPDLRGARGIATYAGMAFASGLLLRTDLFREHMRGGIPFVLFLLVVALIQPKKRAPCRAEA
jgi:hypothetical protein